MPMTVLLGIYVRDCIVTLHLKSIKSVASLVSESDQLGRNEIFLHSENTSVRPFKRHLSFILNCITNASNISVTHFCQYSRTT